LAPEGIQVVDPLTITFNPKAANSLFALAVGDKKAGRERNEHHVSGPRMFPMPCSSPLHQGGRRDLDVLM
jgi:hypothetical protein